MNTESARSLAAPAGDAHAHARWSPADVVAADARLVSLPEIYMRARQTLDDPHAGLADLAEIIAQDPAMSARLLKLANSALYGLVASVGTVRQAVTLLGVQQVNDLVLMTSVARAFRGIDNGLVNMDLFWETSIRTAALSCLMGRSRGVAIGDGLFAAGLLHDLGHLLMYQVVAPGIAEVVKHPDFGVRPQHRIEAELIGCHYAEVGGELFAAWQLPPYLTLPVRYHVEPAAAPAFEVESAILHLAATLARAAAPDLSLADCDAPLDPAVLELAGLDEAECRALLPEADKLSREVLGLIFPGHGELV